LGSQAGAVRRLLDDCADLAPDEVRAAEERWTARFASGERRSLLAARRRARSAIAGAPAARAAWSRAQVELPGTLASAGVWKPRRTGAGSAPETFAEAALMAVVAGEHVAEQDYRRLVESAGTALPWLLPRE